MTLAPGAHVGPYQIVSQLGSGGMGVVYTAHDPRLDRQVAIKVLPPELIRDDTAKQRFLQEAKAASALDHPNICTIHEINETTDGQLYLVMAYYEGETLTQRIARGPLALDDAIDIATQVGQGLAEAHGAGIVHRDIKPANLLIAKSGVVKILDFGLAKLAGSEGVTQAGTTLGTVSYMSPEQARGQAVDQRTDIWSLGVVLFEMLSGQRPFQGENLLAISTAILESQPSPLTGASSTVQGVVRRALNKHSEQRYQAVTDLLGDLRAVTSTPEAATVTPRDEIPSIAVLPFTNMSADPEQEYFCDGMAEEIINALTKLEGLRVVARTSAFQFKGQAQDLRRVGKALNVRSVLEGSVRTAGARLRVTAQLINVDDGYHLWSERYDRPMDDVFAIQDEITGRIVDSLKSKLAVGSTSLTSPREARPTENREAYDLFLRALYYEGLRTKQGFQTAIDYYQRALVLEADYAAAYAGLSRAYTNMNTYGFSSADQALPKAESAAIRALELDDSSSEAHAALGSVRAWLHWDWAGAESEFRLAIEREPGRAQTRYQYAARCLGPSGRTKEAVAEAGRAHDLDPLSALMNRGMGENLYWDRQYTEAIRQLRRTVDMAPDFPLARNLLALVYTSNDQLEEAFRERLEILRLSGHADQVPELEAAWAEAGEPGMLRWYIERGLPKAEKARSEGGGGNRAWHLALLYARLGEVEDALGWLEEAVRQRGGLMVFAKVHPWLDSLHPNPRFGKVLERQGLA